MFVFVVFVCLFFFFLIIQSQAAFLNCLYVARFTIVHSKTLIKFPLLCPFLVGCSAWLIVLGSGLQLGNNSLGESGVQPTIFNASNHSELMF